MTTRVVPHQASKLPLLVVMHFLLQIIQNILEIEINNIGSCIPFVQSNARASEPGRIAKRLLRTLGFKVPTAIVDIPSISSSMLIANSEA